MGPPVFRMDMWDNVWVYLCPSQYKSCMTLCSNTLGILVTWQILGHTEFLSPIEQFLAKGSMKLYNTGLKGAAMSYFCCVCCYLKPHGACGLGSKSGEPLSSMTGAHSVALRMVLTSFKFDMARKPYPP